MTTMRSFLSLSLLPALALAAAAQSAPSQPRGAGAQPPAKAPQAPPTPASTRALQTAPSLQGPAGAPVAAAAPQAQPPQPQQPLTFGWREGAERLLLELDAERCVAFADGKPLPAERVRRSNNRIVVLDGAGAVTAQVTLFAGGGSLQTFPERRRAAIGVRLETPDSATAAAMGCQAMELRRVTAVTAGQPAAAAGIRAGDVLVEIDGKTPVTEAHLRTALARRKPGDELPLTVVRDGKKMSFVVKLAGVAPVADPLRPYGLDRQPYVALDGGRMLVMEPRTALQPGQAGQSRGGEHGDPVQELRAVQERLEKMERLLEQVIELREKNQRDGTPRENPPRPRTERDRNVRDRKPPTGGR